MSGVPTAAGSCGRRGRRGKRFVPGPGSRGCFGGVLVIFVNAWNNSKRSGPSQGQSCSADFDVALGLDLESFAVCGDRPVVVLLAKFYTIPTQRAGVVIFAEDHNFAGPN
jgi:hypothetical protein